MRVLVAGGTGFIGEPLCQRLIQHGHEVMILTRHPDHHVAQSHLRWLSWQDETWRRSLSATDAIINLAGASIGAGRWTARRKQAIRASRLQATQALIDAIAAVQPQPRVLVNASAVGYYGPRDDEPLPETAAAGDDFLAQLCQAWEARAQRAQPLGVRVARLRIGLVLGPRGGALAKMAPPFQWGIGGPLGSGRQWVSWIHREDVIGLIEWILTHEAVSGAVNATAPNPVQMHELCRELGRVLRRPSWLPVPALALRLLLGEMADLLLTGQRVIPRTALESGYAFHYPLLPEALAACLQSGAPP